MFHFHALGKSAGSDSGEQLLVAGGAVREREFEVLGDQLLDVWSLDVIFRGELDDFEDLYVLVRPWGLFSNNLFSFCSTSNLPLGVALLRCEENICLGKKIGDLREHS